MAVRKTKSIIMKIENRIGMRLFSCCIRVAVVVLFYLTVIGACGMTVARWLALLPALCIIVPAIAFGGSRKVRLCLWGVVAIYTVLTLAIGFSSFADGAKIFGDLIAESVNASRHSGWEYSGVAYSMAADFAFSSVAAMWFSAGTMFVCRRTSVVFAFVALVVIITLMIIGLTPTVYFLVPFVIVWLGQLVDERGFSLKSAWTYVVVMTVVCALLGLCLVYGGSTGVQRLRAEIAEGAENAIYGSDTLPQGELGRASELHKDDKLRLSVTLSSNTPKLYLKGFVGSDMVGNAWHSTDKNIYVQDEYTGLMNYIYEGGLPFLQYAKYSALSGKADKFAVSVENVGANGKYTYVPYGLRAYTVGTPYYDLGIHNGVGGAKSYEYSVFCGDYSGEWTVQEKWLTDPALRSVAMKEYLQIESEYRAFVYDNYLAIDEQTKALIGEKLFGIGSASINTAARLLRQYFEEHFVLSDKPDDIGDDFLTSFLGGGIYRANSVYYATVATYAFRSFGYAARYVEGYLVKADEEGSGAQTVEVTSKDAHAWTEVYFDGIGWLPIEVTFEVKDPTEVNPIDPGDETPPDVDPEPPDFEPPQEVKDPAVKPGDGSGGLTPTQLGLMKALKVLIPILCVLLVGVLAAFGVILRRSIVLGRKNKRLEARGSDFGRVAYGIAERDCRSIGGIDGEELARLGISQADTARFNELIEKSVYGEYDLNVNERNIVIRYMNSVAAALTENGGKLNFLICKYFRCLGL